MFAAVVLFHHQASMPHCPGEARSASLQFMILAPGEVNFCDKPNLRLRPAANRPSRPRAALGIPEIGRGTKCEPVGSLEFLPQSTETGERSHFVVWEPAIREHATLTHLLMTISKAPSRPCQCVLELRYSLNRQVDSAAVPFPILLREDSVAACLPFHIHVMQITDCF